MFNIENICCEKMLLMLLEKKVTIDSAEGYSFNPKHGCWDSDQTLLINQHFIDDNDKYYQSIKEKNPGLKVIVELKDHKLTFCPWCGQTINIRLK